MCIKGDIFFNTSYYIKPKNLCFLLAFFNMMKYPLQYTFLHKIFIRYSMLYQWLSTAVIVLLMMGTENTRNM
jgi:hypothetical protein